MQRNIPGFYFDEDKKKYFRIQRNHTLPAASATYSEQSVKAKQEQKRNEAQEEQRKRQLHVSHIKRSPLVGTSSYRLLQCQIRGSKSPLNNCISTEFAHKLTSRPAYRKNAPDRLVGERIAAQSFHISKEGILTMIQAHDNVNDLVYTVRSSNSYGKREEYAYVLPNNDLEAGLQIDPIRPGAVSLTGFNAPHNDLFTYVNETWMVTRSTLSDRVYHRLELPMAETVWDIASCPFSTDVAMVGENGLYLGRGGADHLHTEPWASEAQQQQAQQGKVSSFKLVTKGSQPKEWRPQWNVAFKDVNIIMSGEGSGIVNFCDRRALSGISRLQHSSAVLGTRPTKHGDQVIVHGFSTTAIYDLRYTKAVVVTSRSRNKSVNNNKRFKPEKSQALVDFAVPQDRYTDRYSRGKKVTYSAELDVVVASSTRTHLNQTRNYVTMYSAITGKPLQGPLTAKQFGYPVTCVDIARVRDGPESIFTLGGGQLLEWTIHPDIESDSERR